MPDEDPQLPDESGQAAEQTANLELDAFETASRRSNFEREQDWLNTKAQLKRDAAQSAWGVAKFVVLVALTLTAAAVAAASVTYFVHLFFPGLGWLDTDQQHRIFSIYPSVAQVGLPVAILTNSWLVWLASRKNKSV